MLEGYAKRLEDRRGHRYSTAHFSSRLVDTLQFDNKAHKSNCTDCFIMPTKCRKKGKNHCKRKQTIFFSDDCPGKPPLCIMPCFRM